MLIYNTHNMSKLINKINKKNVLILGSGPSAREVNWENVNFDTIITTSFFYLNEKVLEKSIYHVSLSKLIDLENTNLLNYLRKNKNCTISFEPKISKYLKNKAGQKEEEILSFVNNSHKFYASKSFNRFYKEFSNKIFFYRAEGGLEGLAGRIIWPTLKSNPKKIYLCGIDGISKNWEKDPQNYFREHKGTTDKHYTYEKYKKSFEDYGERVYKEGIKRKIKIINLGKGKNYNLMTPISEKYENS